MTLFILWCMITAQFRRHKIRYLNLTRYYKTAQKLHRNCIGANKSLWFHILNVTRPQCTKPSDHQQFVSPTWSYLWQYFVLLLASAETFSCTVGLSTLWGAEGGAEASHLGDGQTAELSVKRRSTKCSAGLRCGSRFAEECLPCAEERYHPTVETASVIQFWRVRYF